MKVGATVVYVNIRILRRLKEELAQAIDKQLWVISYKMLFKTVNYITKKLKNKAVLNLKEYCMHYYVTLTK